jgi:membrane peptidoglycan carboxypeptidase
VVLDVMEDAGSITPSEHAAVHLDKVKMAAEPAQNSVRYFTDWALPQLDTLIGTDNTEPVEVWTTLDPKMQSAATAAVAANAPRARRARWCRWTATAACWPWSAARITSPATTTAPRRPCASPARRGSCSSIWPRWNPA